MFESGIEIKTGYNDEDIPKGKNNIGCAKCDYSGYLMKDGKFDYCDCYIQEQLNVRARKSRIPKEYLQFKNLKIEGLVSKKKPYSSDMADFRDVNPNEDFLKIKKNFLALKEDGWNFILEGPTGTGKTSFACLIGKVAIYHDCTVLFLEMEELRKLWTGETLPEDLIKARLLIHSVDLLILDDLGKEFASEKSNFFLTKFDSLIRSRIAEKKMTIYTTNINQERMVARYDERIYSLLQTKNIHYLLFRDRDLRTETTLPDFLL